MDSGNDFNRACEGLTLNGIFFKRLVGTTGGIKNSTIVFVAESTIDGFPIRDTLIDRINNGRDKQIPLVPAKFEAYRALSCSASRIVTQPSGVIVINDCITHFKSDYILLDDKNDGEPVLTEVHDGNIELNCSDGFGFVSVRLASIWSNDLNGIFFNATSRTNKPFKKNTIKGKSFTSPIEVIATIHLNTQIFRNKQQIIYFFVQIRNFFSRFCAFFKFF